MKTCTPPPPWPHWQHPPEELAPGGGPAAVARALAWLQALGERQGLPPKTLWALTLCADEALTNIAAYARSASGTPAQLRLACGPVAEGLALCIADDGTAFDPTAQESTPLATSLDEAQVGGHGLRLLRHYLRALHYRRTPEGNELLLVL